MKGLELSRKYFEEYGRKMLEEEFSEILDKIAVGLIGSGSECLGYDDDISTDHDFEPGFCIFIPGEDVVSRKYEFLLERAYAKLPKEFMGIKRSNLSPVGGNRHGVIRITDYFNNHLGNESGELSLKEWLTIEQNYLLECTNGEIYFDNYGLLTSIRNKLAFYPNDIMLKKIAGSLLLMAQSGQYNYERCLYHNEYAAAQIACYKFVENSLKVIYLLNRKYMPYYKWSFKGLKSLDKFSELSDMLEFLITSDNSKKTVEIKKDIIEHISSEIIKELQSEKMTEAVCLDLEKHAYSVNDGIQDNYIRNLNILAAV